MWCGGVFEHLGVLSVFWEHSEGCVVFLACFAFILSDISGVGMCQESFW